MMVLLSTSALNPVSEYNGKHLFYSHRYSSGGRTCDCGGESRGHLCVAVCVCVRVCECVCEGAL